MTVKRVVANIRGASPADAEGFYERFFGLEVVMDHGWIRTYASGTQMEVQVSVASQGGSGTPVPGLSIEVDNLDEVLGRMVEAGVEPEYGPVDEPWGVRRFYVRDPFGTLVNVLAHNE